MYAILVLFASAAVALESPQTSKKYRDDYEYNQPTNSFFKLHIDGETYNKAAEICQMEGGALMVPRSIQDLAEVHALFKQFPDIGDLLWIGDDGEVHESEENEAMFKYPAEDETMTEYVGFSFGHTLNRCPVLNRDGQIDEASCSLYRQGDALPFVCKVDLPSAPFDAECDVYSKDYVYKPTVGSCYKLSKQAVSWNQAYSECVHQNAHLVVLNSKAESLVVKQLMSAAPLLRDAYSPYYYIAGMRVEKTANSNARVFKTIFNQTLEAAGFAEWADTEPNNTGGHEDCGSLFEGDGKYNDQQCLMAYSFICEKEKTAST